MKILKRIILGIFILVFEYSMFQISTEIGLVSLFLICVMLSIWTVLKKITTVVVNPELIPSSTPFRDSPNSTKNDILPESQINYDSGNLIPGVNADIFEQFREKLNLNTTQENTVSQDPHNPQDSQPSEDPLSNEDPTIDQQNNRNQDLVTETYQNSHKLHGPDNFSEELDEVEQVKVTLSEKAKPLLDDHEDISEDKLEDEKKDNQRVKEAIAAIDKQEKITIDFGETDKKLGSGEAELELLSRKHKELKEQTEKIATEPLEDFDEDLFADELIQIPGGESHTDSHIFSDDDPFTSLSDSYSMEDEQSFGSSLQGSASQEEKQAEAEAMLKLATTTCESGRMDESKASLNSYFNILKELGKKPPPDVLQLADKLELSLDSSINNAEASKNNLPETEIGQIKKTVLEDVPEQTNYANVMDGIVRSLEEKAAYEEALPLLNDLLKYNRERVNISAMDPLYDRIEQAHSSMQNDEELVSTYKEHLAIKQQLGDLEGELHLLDLISYYYANTSDQKASERYQAESKRIKESLEYKKEQE